MMKRKWVRRLVYVVLLVAAGVTLRYTVFRPAPVPVTVFRASRGRVEETVITSKAGTVKSRRRATLSPEIGGRVTDLPAEKWQRVRKGDVVLRLADADYRAQVALQERSLEAAQASAVEACRTAEQAEIDLARNLKLAAEQIISQSILDEYRSRRDVAASACDAARARESQAAAALDLARVNLAKTVVRAPFDGVIADLKTELGEWLMPSPPGLPMPLVIDVIDPDAIYVSAPLDEVDLAKVREGQTARITMDAFPQESFPGRVTRVAPYVLDVQEQNRTFEVEVEFDDDAFARTLLPGTSADVEVILGARDDVLRIPSYALMEGNRVLVVSAETLAARPVETGLRNWEFAEIVSGLAPGDPVVVSLDRAEVKEGAKVRITAETTK